MPGRVPQVAEAADRIDPVEPVDPVVVAGDRRHRLESMVSVGASAGIYALAFVTGPLLAQFLGAEGRGNLAAVLVPTQLLSWVLMLGVPLASGYYARQVGPRRLYASSWVLSLAVGIPVGALVWALAPAYLADYEPATVTWLRIGLVLGLVMLPMGTALEVLRATGGAGVRFNVMRTFGPLANFVVLVVLALLDRLTLETALASAVLSNFWHALVVVALLRAWPAQRFERAVAAMQLRFGLRSALGDVSSLVVARLDQLLMVSLVDSRSLGLYVVAVTAATVSTPLAQGLAAALFPHLLHAAPGEQADRLRSALGWTTVITVLTTVGLAATAPFLLPWAFGEPFRDALPALWLLLPGQVCLNLSTVRSAALQAKGKPGWASIASAVSAGVTVAGVVPAVALYGIEGAAVLTSLSQAAQLAVLLVVGRDRKGPGAVQPRRARHDRGVIDTAGRRPTALPQRRRHRSVAVPVVVSSLVGAVLASLLAWPWLSAGWTAAGTVRMSEITGNRPAFEYNAFGEQFQEALDGDPVARAVAAVVPDGEAVTDITMSRRAEASRVTLHVAATDERTARDALLTAGRAAYGTIVDAERDGYAEDELLAQERLRAASSELETLRLAADAQGSEVEQSPLYRQLDQAVGRAVADLSTARTGLALTDAVESGLGRSNAVTVDETFRRSPASELLRVALGGALAGAALGAAVGWIRARRLARAS